jgi:hypothetical protein
MHAGSEAMFADLGHFSYSAIQVIFTFLDPISFFYVLTMLICILISRVATGCFFLFGLSSTYLGIYGSSCLLIATSQQQPPNQLLCLSPRCLCHFYFYRQDCFRHLQNQAGLIKALAKCSCLDLLG